MKIKELKRKINFFRERFRYGFDFLNYGYFGEYDILGDQIDYIVNALDKILDEIAKTPYYNKEKIESEWKFIYDILKKHLTSAFYKSLKGCPKSQKEKNRKEWSEFIKYGFYRDAINFFKKPIEIESVEKKEFNNDTNNTNNNGDIDDIKW